MLIVRRAEELGEFVKLRVVTILSRTVRTHEHPLARHILWRGEAHLRAPLTIRPPVRVRAQRIETQPLAPAVEMRLELRGRVEGGLQELEQPLGADVALHDGIRRRGGAHLRELPPKDGVVDCGALQQLLQLRPKRLARLLVPRAEAKLLPPHLAHLRVEERKVIVLHDALQVVETTALAVEERYERAREGHQVDLRGERLPFKPKLALHVRREGRPELVVPLDEAKGAVVHCPTVEQAIVRIHVALHVADAQPRDSEVDLPRAKDAHHLQQLLAQRQRCVDLREVALDRVPHERFELGKRARLRARRAARVQLEVADAEKGGRSAARDRAPLIDDRVGRVLAPAVARRVPEPADELRA
mmetsp:Transcript_8308/g.26304  ORF Transcript_8308/g.26304 Transcript_8308/m.26304 type:complete len:359 (-) Transcript_8308:338-1414(-)